MTNKYIFPCFALCACLLAGCLSEKHRFSFNENGKFKIAQFTDIHWVHGSPTTARSIESIKAVLAIEKPDLAILTGDLVYRVPAKEPWTELANIFDEAKIPFTVALGNHDRESCPNEEIFEILSRSPYFVGEKGPKDITGTGNFVLQVYDRANKPAALIYCLDSNKGPVYFDQIAWYRKQSDKYTADNNGKPLPAVAFFHIPVPEYFNVLDKKTTIGIHREKPCPPDHNTGLLGSFYEKKDVMGVFVGHEHLNDYIGIELGIALAYGRVSGWEAYGDLERGARIIELYENEFVFDTWISTPLGVEQIFNYPTTISSIDEETMTYLPAKNVKPTKQGVSYTYYEGKFASVRNIHPDNIVSQGVMKDISILDAATDNFFAYEFRSLIKIPEKAVYNFYVISDYDSQIYINDQLIADKTGGSTALLEEKVALEAGYHEMKVLYYQHRGRRMLEIGYSSKNIRRQKLPDEIFFVE